MLTEERIREIVKEELQKFLTERSRQKLETLKLFFECPDESIQDHPAPLDPYRIQ